MDEADLTMPAAPVMIGRKPKTSIYVVMLVISLVALLLGCLFLYLEIKRYGGFGVVPGQVAAAMPSNSAMVAASDSRPGDTRSLA